MLRQSGAGTGSHFPEHAHFWVILDVCKVSACRTTGTWGILCQSPTRSCPLAPQNPGTRQKVSFPTPSQWPNISSSQIFCPPWPKIPCKRTHSTSHKAVLYTHIYMLWNVRRWVFSTTNTDAAASWWGFKGLSLYLKVEFKILSITSRTPFSWSRGPNLPCRAFCTPSFLKYLDTEGTISAISFHFSFSLPSFSDFCLLLTFFLPNTPKNLLLNIFIA